MAREAKTIIREFGRHLTNAQLARMDMGKLFIELSEVVGSKEAACDQLNDAYPDAKDRLGYDLTVFRLNQYATLHRSFDGGIRKGKRVLTKDEVGALGLTPTELVTLADKCETDAIRIKDVQKQVKKARAGIEGNDASKVEEARAQVRAWLNESERPASLADRITELTKERDRKAKTAERALAEVARLEREIAALTGEGETEETEEETVAEVIPTAETAEQPAAAAA